MRNNITDISDRTKEAACVGKSCIPQMIAKITGAQFSVVSYGFGGKEIKTPIKQSPTRR